MLTWQSSEPLASNLPLLDQLQRLLSLDPFLNSVSSSLPQGVDTSGMSFKLIQYVQALNPPSVAIKATDTRISRGTSKLTLEYAVFDGVLHLARMFQAKWQEEVW